MGAWIDGSKNTDGEIRDGVWGDSTKPNGADVATIDGKVDTIVSDVTTIDGKADTLQSDLDNATDGLGALKALIDTVDSKADTLQSDLDNATDGLGALKALIDTVDGIVDAIKLKTDFVCDALYHVAAADSPQQVASTAWTDAGGVSYTKVKEIDLISLGDSSILRTKFTIYAPVGETTYGRIYKNGVAHGTERIVSGASSSFTEDLTFTKDDLLQLYCKNSSGAGGGSSRGLWVYGTATLLTYKNAL